jgi:hypothetical protein
MRFCAAAVCADPRPDCLHWPKLHFLQNQKRAMGPRISFREHEPWARRVDGSESQFRRLSYAFGRSRNWLYHQFAQFSLCRKNENRHYWDRNKKLRVLPQFEYRKNGRKNTMRTKTRVAQVRLVARPLGLSDAEVVLVDRGRQYRRRPWHQRRRHRYGPFHLPPTEVFGRLILLLAVIAGG